MWRAWDLLYLLCIQTLSETLFVSQVFHTIYLQMNPSKLQMNDNKTDSMAIDTWSKLSQVFPILTPLSISGYDISFSQ